MIYLKIIDTHYNAMRSILFNREGEKINYVYIEDAYNSDIDDLLKSLFNSIREGFKIYIVDNVNSDSLSDFLYNRYTNELDLKGIEQLIIDNGGELIYDKN